MARFRSICMILAGTGLAFVAPAASAQAQPPATPAVQPRPNVAAQPVRKSITQLTPAELASLRRGYAQMIAWNSEPSGSPNFRRSLRYWANMHAFIGTGCGPVGALNYPGMSGLSVQTEQTPDENSTWCTCQHGTPQFLTWHRMYLYYFEQALQAAAGDPTLRLPVWDYQTDGHIPEAFRTATYVDANGQTVDNPLYVANRQAQLNSGAGALTPAVVSTTGAMGQTSYGPFNSALEQTPHGAVHCATGVAGCPSGYMGYVPTAGNDPIFYSHHANIDRLYECWLQVAPSQRLPSGGMLDATFTFIDGTGNPVTRRVGDMLTTQQLGYRYAAGGGCPRVRVPIFTGVLPERARQVYRLSGPTRLTPQGLRVPLQLNRIPRLQLFSQPDPGQPTPRSAPGSFQQATLVVEGVDFDQHPGVMIEVSLQGPGNERVPVGVINFFNQTAPHSHDGATEADTSARRFDATEALRALGAQAGNAQLVLEPTSGVTGLPLTASQQQLFATRANVRFRAARLELR